MSKIWNYKLIGLPGALFICVQETLCKIADKCTTLVVSHNIKNCGRNVIFMRGLTYRYPKNISVKDNVCIGVNNTLIAESLVCNGGGDLIINQGVTIGDNCNIDFTGGVSLGINAHLAHHVQIITHDHGYNYKATPVGKLLIIGNNVFVGSHCKILPGCNRIGDNAVIGLGSIVTKDVPDNAIVAGCPAKIIKYRE